MLTIEVKNLQSINQAALVIEKGSPVLLTGDNSAGKSIIIRTLRKVMSGELYHEHHRLALINKNSQDQTAYVRITQHDSKNNDIYRRLEILIRKEQGKSGLIYSDSNSSLAIKRSFSQTDECYELLRRFGLLAYRDLPSIQLFELKELQLFYNTPASDNYKIVQSALEDSSVTSFNLNKKKLKSYLSDRYQQTIKELRDKQSLEMQYREYTLSIKEREILDLLRQIGTLESGVAIPDLHGVLDKVQLLQNNHRVKVLRELVDIPYIDISEVQSLTNGFKLQEILSAEIIKPINQEVIYFITKQQFKGITSAPNLPLLNYELLQCYITPQLPVIDITTIEDLRAESLGICSKCGQVLPVKEGVV